MKRDGQEVVRKANPLIGGSYRFFSLPRSTASRSRKGVERAHLRHGTAELVAAAARLDQASRGSAFRRGGLRRCGCACAYGLLERGEIMLVLAEDLIDTFGGTI